MHSEHIRTLVSDDRLREAIDYLLEMQPLPASLVRTTLLQFKSQLTALEQDTLRRTESAELLETRRNRLRIGLLHCADALDRTAGPETRSNSRLKQHAFYLLLAGKVFLLAFIAFHFHIHAFSQSETLTLIGLITPVLVGYLLTAVKGLKTPGLSEDAQAHLSLLRGMVYVGLPLYFMVLVWIMLKVPLDEWTFETARNWMIGIEAAFGGLVVYMVKVMTND